jgi:hypothetical protein
MLVEWDDVDVNYVPLGIISQDVPISVAESVKKNNLLNTQAEKHYDKYFNIYINHIRSIQSKAPHY